MKEKFEFNWGWIKTWTTKRILNEEMFAQLLEKYFFPKWVFELEKWISEENIDFDVLGKWYVVSDTCAHVHSRTRSMHTLIFIYNRYQGWKAIFSSFVKNNYFTNIFVYSLNIIDHCIHIHLNEED